MMVRRNPFNNFPLSKTSFSPILLASILTFY
jgi:hypothetical protein